MSSHRSPTHPGTVIRREFLDELEITPYRLAKEIKVDPARISQILAGKRAISADTALRLGRYFGTGPEFWISLQSKYDLRTACQELGDELETIQPFSRPDLAEPFNPNGDTEDL